jgi:starch-binding outer membrane protein, SusD/RagB family
MKQFFSKALLLTIISSCIFYSSCDKKKLDLLPHGPTEAVYFSTESEFSKAILGVYAKLTDLYGRVVLRDGNSSPQSTLMPIYLLPGDDITTNNTGEEFEIFGSLQSSSGRINDFYKALYQVIGRSNVVLEKIDQVADGVYTTANLKDAHKGEALFLRGFANYYLWNYFGTAPLNTQRVLSEDQFTPAGTTGTQLLDQAIADFTQAASLLPASWDNSNRGRATKNSANGMLGKSLVFKASATKTATDYAAALAAFNSITGASLVAKFDDNFAPDTENNAESIFEFQAAGPSGGNNLWLPNDFDNAIGNMLIDWNYYNGDELYGTSKFYVTQKLVGAFDPADPRRALTLDPADRSVKKYVARDGKYQGWQPGSIDNYRILRLADVKLLQAEAILQSGGSAATAIGLINEIRTRARNTVPGSTAPADYATTETNATTIMNWIMNERFLELAGEGQRWLDLRRWHMQGIITLDNTFFNSNLSSLSFQAPKHLLLPIPTGELDVNPNVPQNTGY